ncbi:Glutamine cyclotransferase [Tenacibaculum sp. MAR_2009_124]|uniref:glutaminyl-peptide cyclotransferase n=1 Tax=Tenacibaculum sp. MAR_2009_124 TaxID=1250059 RepID=UPI000898E946|nr:glutaminyl-peptide cyclotransferase [Tenacibaculum sp. MAR_2009_124]SEC85874.1 Glutamine cyclotransferase [Tenacibaculum sp. MAR_2009_124]
MNIYKYLAFTCLAGILLTSCSENNYKFKLNTTKKANLGAKANIEFEQLKGNKIDSVHIYVNKKRVNKNETKVSFNTSDFGVGKHLITAIAFYPNKSKKLNNSIEVFADKRYTSYKFKIVNTYPHDNKAYTQGLEYHNGFLYETTGRRGKSSLRKVELKTGKVLQQINLDKKYFGEGMTIFDNKIYWLTWQARKGFIYSLDTFEKIGSFNYNKSNEGWGLTHNDNELIKSDGTNKIWFLNPSDQKEKRNIQVYTNKLTIKELNELELINGKIYANYWKKPLIAIINPENGIVEGIINLTGLVEEMKKTQSLVDEDEVLNGIAFDKENNRMFVTGKNWNKLFEIEIIKQ